MSENLLSAKDTAKQLGISTKTLYKYCDNGWLTYIKLPGKRPTYKFRQAALDLFLAQHTKKAKANRTVD